MIIIHNLCIYIYILYIYMYISIDLAGIIRLMIIIGPMTVDSRSTEFNFFRWIPSRH